jgi:hypothetical protein
VQAAQFIIIGSQNQLVFINSDEGGDLNQKLLRRMPIIAPHYGIGFTPTRRGSKNKPFTDKN